MRVLLKSGEIFEEQNMSEVELTEWFKSNSDEEGNVQSDIVLFEEIAIKANADGSFDWLMSNMDLDRDLEKIDPSGWDLKNFKKNPVILWSHDYYRPAIGKAKSTRVKDANLIGKIQFSSREVDPFASMIEGKVREGILSAGSVGFKALKIEYIEDEKDPTRLIMRKQELYEFSIVNVPALPAAMVQEGEDGKGENDMSKITALEGRVTELEKQSKSYVRTLLQDVGREPSKPKGRETIDLEKMFDDKEPDETKNLMEVLNGST